jgi:hypothetical protein
VPLAGLFLLHYLTGDPEAWEAATGIANWLHAARVGLGEGSARAVGWPLRSAMIAYENTYDKKHLEHARKLVEYFLRVMEPRRQFFSEPITTWQYRGGSYGMNAKIAAGLRRYWQATGDARAGRACASMSYNMAYDWMSPREPGWVMSCDPPSGLYAVGYLFEAVLPLFWGYELTGDRTFLEKAAQMMRDENALAQGFDLSYFWEMQDVLFYYGLYKQGA